MVSQGRCEVCGNFEICHDYRITGNRMMRAGKIALQRIACGQCGEFRWAEADDYLCTFCRGIHERPDPNGELFEHQAKVKDFVDEMVQAAKEGHPWDTGEVLRRLNLQQPLDKPMDEP